MEVNYSFYRLPEPETFDRWRGEAPEGFVFAVKANRYITHVKRLKDCAEPLARFLGRCRRLGPHLGPILYQLPPRWRPNIERLGAFARLLPDDLTHVFEFRDDRWFDDPVRHVLAENRLGFCIHDHPGTTCPGWITGRAAYFRFHGSVRGRDGGYTAREIARQADHVRRALEGRRDVYAYYNNDAAGRAVHDARALKDALTRSGVVTRRAL